MVVISVYTYGVKIIKKIRWESGFPWNPPPPLCTNGSAGYLMQLSVNQLILVNYFHNVKVFVNYNNFAWRKLSYQNLLLWCQTAFHV